MQPGYSWWSKQERHGDQHLLKYLEIRSLGQAPPVFSAMMALYLLVLPICSERELWTLALGTLPRSSKYLPRPWANKRQLKDEVGLCLFEVFCELWLHILGCPPWAELSFQPIGGLFPENSFGQRIRAQVPRLSLPSFIFNSYWKFQSE